jgi:transposase-like protein
MGSPCYRSLDIKHRRFAKRQLSMFNGYASEQFILHLKKCGFRYNHRNEII